MRLERGEVRGEEVERGEFKSRGRRKGEDCQKMRGFGWG